MAVISDFKLNFGLCLFYFSVYSQTYLLTFILLFNSRPDKGALHPVHQIALDAISCLEREIFYI